MISANSVCFISPRPDYYEAILVNLISSNRDIIIML